ncbi:MAG: hydroxyacid dehydrogenase, partial [Pseudolabrys sp.]|nr:hydroxyacid dehydrogenase [Pseudolabrys sp.]
VAKVPEFIARAHADTQKAFPGSRPLAFGHLGDGNLHYNVIQPEGMDKEAWLARWHDVNKVVFDIVLSLNGSISAEHGVGVMKRDLLPSIKDKTAIEVMRAIKRTLDPNGILNPGKVL